MKKVFLHPSSAASSSSEAVAILGGGVIALALLEKVMDGVPIPFVKGCTGAALEVIKMSKKIQASKLDCEDLLRRSTSLLVVILSSFNGKTEAQIPEHLIHAVERLTASFHDVLNELEEINRRGKRPLLGLAYAQDNAEKLKGCVAKLDWAMNEFQVTSKVDSCLKDLERHEELRKGQAEILEAVERIQQEISIPAAINVSTAMPPEPRIFGREEYVEKAINLILSSTAARLAILGPGGMGKTSVSLKIVHDTRVTNRFGANRHWVPCEEATSSALFVELLAKSLDLRSSESNDRFGDVMNALRSSIQPHLFLLDNFETPWDIEGEKSNIAQLLTNLGSVPSVSFIVTMRGNQYPASDSVTWSQPQLPSLSQLELDAAHDAFVRISPESASDPKLNLLIKELDCMPLAVTLMAKLAAGGEAPSQLLSEWKQELTGLLDQAGGDRLSSIEVSIKLSMQSNAIRNCPEATILLSMLSKLPDATFIDHLPSMCPSIHNWRHALRVLRGTALVYDSPDRLAVRVLSPIRAFILLHHPLEARFLHDVQSAYFKLAAKGNSAPGEADFIENCKELGGIEANMEAILLDTLNDGGDLEACIEACLWYSNYLYWTQPREDIIAVAVRKAKESGSKLLARCLESLGKILLQKFQYDAAESALNEARSEFFAVGHRLGAAQCLQSLGQILLQKFQYDAAVSALNEARSEFVAVGHRLGAAQCLQSLGQILLQRSEYDAAESALNEARSEFVALGDRLSAAQCLQSLGQILLQESRYYAAESALDEARSEFIAVGSRLGATQCLQSLGQVLLQESRYDAAESALNEARSQFVALGDRLSAAQCLQSLGEILQKKSQYAGAESALDEERSDFVSVENHLGAVARGTQFDLIYTIEPPGADGSSESITESITEDSPDIHNSFAISPLQEPNIPGLKADQPANSNSMYQRDPVPVLPGPCPSHLKPMESHSPQRHGRVCVFC